MENYTVLPNSVGGGPHGLGDPDDLRLRKIELDVLIKKMVRTKARTEKCAQLVRVFEDCCKESSFAMVYKCRSQNDEMRKCMEKWFNDEELNKACKEEYLKDRSEYRRTGLPKKDRERMEQLNAL